LVGYLAISGFTVLALALAWNRPQVKPGQNKLIDGTDSDFQDFDRTNYRYVLGDLGCFILLIVG